VTDSARLRSANRRLSLALVAVVVAMFGFGYVVLPLFYDALRAITGPSGKPAGALEAPFVTPGKAALRFTKLPPDARTTTLSNTFFNAGAPS
jgi:hypothetical protein